jgi:hypothetical protein
MKHTLTVLAIVLLAAAVAQAHFVFVVPDAEGRQARVIISESLLVDPEVNPELVRPSQLKLRSGGKDVALELAQTRDSYVVQVAGSGTRVVHGVTNLGVSTQGPDGKPHVLIYYPKAIIGDPFDPQTTVGANAVVELVPVRDASGLRLKLIARGVPKADAEVTLVTPEGDRKLRTNDAGLTEVITTRGQLGSWARLWEESPGTRNGDSYSQVRHYATLTFSVSQ